MSYYCLNNFCYIIFVKFDNTHFRFKQTLFQLLGNSYKIASVLSTVVNEIKKVLETKKKSKGAQNMLVKDFKIGMKVQIKVTQKDFLEVFLTKDFYIKDILAIAKNLSNRDEKKFKQEAETILKIEL